MKKLLLAIFSLISIISYSQTTGYLRYDTVKVMKQNGNSNLIIENATRDSLGFLYNYGGGRTKFEVIRSVPGGIKVGEDTIYVSGTTEDIVIDGGDIVYSGSGYTFNITPTIFRLNNVIYTADSGSFTLSASDAGLNRIDRVYFDTIGSGFHILEGVPGLPALEPQVGGDQVGWSFISVPAGSVAPSVVVVYDENTGESTVTNVGTTTDPNNTASFFRGTKSTRITNINANDRIIYTAPVTWDLSDKTTFSTHIKLSAVLGTGNYIYVSFLVGSTRVSLEVLVPINRTNITTWQPISIQMTNFGTLQSSDITAVQYRYVGSSAVYAGLDVDYIFFQSGITQPAPPTANVFPNIIPPPTWGVSGNGTQNITITAPGLRDKILRGGGTAETDSSVKYVGALDGQAKNATGGSINGNTYYNQTSDASNPGINTALRHRQVDTLLAQTVEPGGGGDSLVYAIDPFRTGIKDLVAGSNITITPTDTTLVIASTGGGGNTLYNADDTLSGNRLVAGDGNSLTFRNVSEFKVETPGFPSGVVSRIVADAGGTTIYSNEGNALVGASDGRVDILGDTYIDGLSEVKTAKQLYYNTSTKRITYGDSTVGGGGGGSQDLESVLANGNSADNSMWILGNQDINFSGDLTEGSGLGIRGGAARKFRITPNSDDPSILADMAFAGLTATRTYTFPNASGTIALTSDIAAETDPVVGAINGIVKANGAGTISAATAGTDYVTPTGTTTLTNKRWTPRVGSTTSSATPTINTDNVDIYKLTAQTADITSFTTNLSGAPVDGDVLEIQITGTAARAITWGASFVASTVALPTTTVTTATLSVVFQYFTTSSYGNNKWVVVNNF